ncbi:MAG: hypothetical protein GAK36_00278 [Pseudomonas sp.]|nr:MAG: hypothetical protein GAK36_00278 [Pseudomonas sp.]
MSHSKISKSVNWAGSTYLRPESLDYAYSVVRPMRFYTEGILLGSGSCFLVGLNGRAYAVTAKHVPINQMARFEEARILMPGSDYSLPIIGHFCPRSTHLTDEHIDILVYLVDLDKFRSLGGGEVAFIDLDECFFPAKHLIGKGAAVVGYPALDDRYDYENKKIYDTILVRTGSISESIYGEPIYMLSSTPSLNTFDGLSGSPVFGATNRTALVGMVVRGTNSSGILHFIDFTVVLSALLVHQADHPEDPAASTILNA